MPRHSCMELAWDTFCSFGVLIDKSLSIKEEMTKVFLPKLGLCYIYMNYMTVVGDNWYIWST